MMPAGALLLVLLSAPPDLPSPLPRGTVPELAAITRRFTEALEAGDVARALAEHSVDAVLMAPGGQIVTGRAAQAAFWRRQRAEGAEGLVLEPERAAVMGVLGYEAGSFHMRPARGADVQQGQFVAVFKKGDEGRWLLVYAVLNHLPPASPPPSPAPPPGR